MVDLVSTTLAVFLCKLLLQNCLTEAFCFLASDGFVLPFWIGSSHCALKAVLLRLTCGLEVQYALLLWQVKESTPSIRNIVWGKLVVDTRDFSGFRVQAITILNRKWAG